MTFLKTTVKCACELKPIMAATLAIDNCGLRRSRCECATFLLRM